MGLWCHQLGVAGWITVIALWVALLAGVVWAICRMFPTRPGPGRRELVAPSPHRRPPHDHRAPSVTP